MVASRLQHPVPADRASFPPAYRLSSSPPLPRSHWLLLSVVLNLTYCELRGCLSLCLACCTGLPAPYRGCSRPLQKGDRHPSERCVPGSPRKDAGHETARSETYPRTRSCSEPVRCGCWWPLEGGRGPSKRCEFCSLGKCAERETDTHPRPWTQLHFRRTTVTWPLSAGGQGATTCSSLTSRSTAEWWWLLSVTALRVTAKEHQSSTVDWLLR